MSENQHELIHVTDPSENVVGHVIDSYLDVATQEFRVTIEQNDGSILQASIPVGHEAARRPGEEHYRSAKDGQFVSEAEAKANPDTTVKET